MNYPKLEKGMLVQLRNGNVYMVLNNILSKKSGMIHLNEYATFLHEHDPYFDIMRVSNVLTDIDLPPENWNKETLSDNLLWDLNQAIESTNSLEVFSNSELLAELKRRLGQ